MSLKIADAHHAIHAGVRKSSKKYSDWSPGWTLTDSGVEGLLVAEIAAAVHGLQSPVESLLLEVPYDKCQQWSGARPRGRKLDTFKGKRADIALFNGSGQTKYIIEVKRRLYKAKTLHTDLTKLCDVMAKCASQQGGKLKRGFLAIFHQGKDYAKVERWTERFFDSGKANAALADFDVRSWNARFFSICIEVDRLASHPTGGRSLRSNGTDDGRMMP